MKIIVCILKYEYEYIYQNSGLYMALATFI